MARIANAADVTDLLETQGPCTVPLDAAAEYVRRRLDLVLPLYVLAMFPHAIVVVLLIGAIAGQRHTDVELYCLYLVGAMIWRWVGLSWLQCQVQQDLQGRLAMRFRSRIFQIILVRIYSSVAITWGSLLAGVPAFYGLFAGSFVTPLLLENSEPTRARLKQAISWVTFASRRLTRILMAMIVIGGLLLVAIAVGQAVLAGTVLPSILGIDTVDLNVTIDSWSWRLSILYFVFLLLDLFWTVASVFLFYDSQSRRMATDLRARLLAVTEAPR